MSRINQDADTRDGGVFTVRPMRAADARASIEVWYRAWCDTYVHPEGFTRQWVDDFWAPRLSEEGVVRLAQEAVCGVQGTYMVAEDRRNGDIVGVAVAQRVHADRQCLQAL
ncbi:hypothetical protein [Actinomyces qiguomingii]|uniref:hypothetical protein n=1 Tax=Actinomyces qiguomingii TaxID=2057800 RepID=UPI000CA00AC9|nr:hypothetical protein [Actinomyces qiguomingii]